MSIVKIPKKFRDILDTLRSGQIVIGLEQLEKIKNQLLRLEELIFFNPIQHIYYSYLGMEMLLSNTCYTLFTISCLIHTCIWSFADQFHKLI